MPLACSGTDVEAWRTVSATWPEAVRRLASSFLRDPVRITVGSDDLTANSRIAQGALFAVPCGVLPPAYTYTLQRLKYLTMSGKRSKVSISRKLGELG
jgi:hypothetical protein